MYKVIRCRIVKITKDDMKFCSARVIWATLEDEKGNSYRVSWAGGPMVIGPTGRWSYRNSADFARAWENAEEGMEVDLYHAKDENFNFFVC